jgi:predicted ArsR family transcriptional regulator
MTEFEQAIIVAIREIVRNTNAPASTIAVAGKVHLSDRQARRYLVKLEARRCVLRMGCRRGWLPQAALY